MGELYPTVRTDELFPSIHIDEFLPADHMGKLYPTVRTDELFPSIHIDEFLPADHRGELCPTVRTDELFPTAHSDDLSQKQVVQSRKSIRLIQVSRQRLATHIDDLSQKQATQTRNQFNSGKSTDGAPQFTWTSSTRLTTLPSSSQQLKVTTLTKSRLCYLGNRYGSYKLADGGQQLTLMTSSKSRPRSLGISSTQANQLTEPNSSHGRALPV